MALLDPFKLPPMLCFTDERAEAEFEAWGFNCGPAAIAAMLGLTPEQVRPHMVGFDAKRYTNPTMMWGALISLGVKYSVTGAHEALIPQPWPKYGLVRIQWAGPWTKPGVPLRARYRHTHWVGAMHSAQGDSIGVWDINAMTNGSGWCSAADWSTKLVPALLKVCEPNADGRWWITHSVEIERPL